MKDVLTFNICLVMLGEPCVSFGISIQTIRLGYKVYVRQINIYTLIKSLTDFFMVSMSTKCDRYTIGGWIVLLQVQYKGEVWVKFLRVAGSII